MEIRFYQNDIETFIESLDPIRGAKVNSLISLFLVSKHGLNMPHSKYIERNLFELRAKDVRLFYCFSNGTAYLLHGFIKKSDRIPQKELRIATARRDRLANT